MEEYQVIGAGGFGKIYQLSNNNVVKAIYDKKLCGDATVEYRKQAIAYDIFNKIKNIHFNDPLIDSIKYQIKVSRPIDSNDSKIIINHQTYACYFTMSLLHGLPLWMYQDIDPYSLTRLDPNFIQNKGMDFEIMAHLSFNTDVGGTFYGVKYSGMIIDEHNPPRGYFMNDNFLLQLQNRFNLNLTKNEISKIIGFIYGILYFHANLIPIDVEIALGYYNNDFVINVLDFGLVIDLHDLEHAPNNFFTSEILKILQENNENLLELTILDELSRDLYCDMIENQFCHKGWQLAKMTYTH